jgi:tetratricopeptide (TPR) repeat protein
MGGSVSLQSLNDCELYGDVPGYTSQPLRTFGVHGIGVIKAGTIILHPMNKQPDNFSVSVTSLQAPDNARKNFEKGQEQVKKRKWAAACDYFKKAVQAYPRYALAWLELGRTQLKQNDFSEAQLSFHQATEQDPRLIDAYVQIAELAVQKHEWKELADATDQIVRLSPDSNHRVPQLEYLYGAILARRGDVDSAISHIQAYLRLAPASADASSAQKKLEELQELVSSPKVASR